MTKNMATFIFVKKLEQIAPFYDCHKNNKEALRVEVFEKITKYHNNDFKPDPGRDILYGYCII